MLEFYWAYADVNQMMELCEELMRTTVFKVLGRTSLRYGELELDFSKPFARLTMKEAVAKHWPAFWHELSNERFDIAWLSDPYQIKRLVVFLDLMEKEVAQKMGADTITRVEWETEVGQDLLEKQKDRIWKESAQHGASSGASRTQRSLEQVRRWLNSSRELPSTILLNLRSLPIFQSPFHHCQKLLRMTRQLLNGSSFLSPAWKAQTASPS